ncbi:MAG: hypothetical protein ABII90_07870 [Bacteroidota bacterium]
MKQKIQGSTPAASAVYGMGLIGAAVYFISHATGFWIGVLGFLKAIACYIIYHCHFDLKPHLAYHLTS